MCLLCREVSSAPMQYSMRASASVLPQKVRGLSLLSARRATTSPRDSHANSIWNLTHVHKLMAMHCIISSTYVLAIEQSHAQSVVL